MSALPKAYSRHYLNRCFFDMLQYFYFLALFFTVLGDYKFFTLFHAKKNDDENRMEYYLRGGDGPPILAYLEHFGGRKNPLFDISTCYLKLDERDDASIITGIILDTDWVEIK